MFKAKAAWIAALMMVWSSSQASGISDSARARITLVIPPSLKVEGLSQMQATQSGQYRADNLCLRGPRSMDYSLRVLDGHGEPSQARADFIPTDNTPGCHGESAALRLNHHKPVAQSGRPLTLMIVAE